jgi:hypothetical protein
VLRVGNDSPLELGDPSRVLARPTLQRPLQ